MLSGLTFGDRAELEREHRKKDKKDKKKHKKSKHRKAKDGCEDATDHGAASDASASQGDDRSPRKPVGSSKGPDADTAAPAVEREAWMTVPMARSTPKLALAEQQQQQDADTAPKEPVEHVGLRIMDPSQTAGAAAGAAAGAGRLSVAAVGDGGASWRLKALKRAQQAARESGQDVSAVLAERWGSAATLAASLTQERAAPDKAHLQEARRRQQHGSSGGGNGSSEAVADRKAAAPAHYLAELRSERPQMMKPRAAAAVSWRRGSSGSGRGDRELGDAREGQQGRRSEPERRDGDGARDEVGAGRGESNGRDGSREGMDGSGRGGSRRGRDGHGSRDGRGGEGQATGSSGRRDRDSRGDERDSRRDREAAGRRSPSPGWHDRSGHGDAERRSHGRGGREGGRGDGEGSSHQRGGRGDALGRDRGREARGGRETREDRGVHDGRPGRDGGRGRRQEGAREADAAVLAMAGALNTFAGDGSFMECFQQAQAAKAGDAGAHNAEAAAQAQGESEQQGGDQLGRGRSASPMSEDEGPSSSGRATGTVAPQGGNRDAAAMLRARLGSGTADGAAAAAAGDDAAAAAGSSAAAAGGSAAGGNRDVAAALRARLSGRAPAAADGRGSSDSRSGEAGPSGRKQVVVLPQVDAQGRAAPGAFGRETAAAAARAQEVAAGGRVPKRVQRYGADGSKERYFADDDNVDLQTLVKRAKYGDDAGDTDRALAANIAARQRFKETDLDVDNEYDYDGGLELYESRKKRGDAEKQARREHERQIAEYKRMSTREEACTHCFASPKRPKQLTIAVGQGTYLALVQRGRLTEGHCCIMPAEHIGSMRQVDEAVWTEVRNFQKCLIQMFMAQGKEVLFLETAVGLGQQRRHAVMEAIPLDPDEMAKAPMYYRKAMQEAESEWSQHAAKAVIETKTKGLRGSVPPNFPYLYVQFGYANGFVHVIDDERKFDVNLGRQVAVGLLRLPAEAMHQRSRTEAPAAAAAAAASFRKAFAPYDWTAQLA